MRPTPDSRSSNEAALLLFAVGLFLPILAGGNVLFLLEPDAAVPLFLLAALAALAVRTGLTSAAPPPRGERAAASLAVLVLAGWWTVTLLLRPHGPRATLMTEGVLAGSLTYFFLARAPVRGPEARGLVSGVVTGAAITTIYAQYQYWVVFPELTPLVREALGHDPILSVNANFYNANCYAAFLAAALLLCAGLVRPGPERAYWPLLPAAALAVTLLQTESRAAIVLLLAAAGVWLVPALSGRRFRQLLPIAALGVAAVAAGLVAGGIIDARELWRTGTLGRFAIWQGAWAMIQDHWALGVGLDQFGEHFWKYRVTGYYTRDPHNLLLQALAETGVVGLAALVGFLSVAFRIALRAVRHPHGRERRLRSSALAAAALLLTHAMLDIDWRAPANPILLFALLTISGQQADGEGA